MSTHADIALIREETAQAGERIYERRVQSAVGPANRGQVVAIHIPSQDYFLGDSLLEATDRLREKYPNAVRGEIYPRGVGEQAVIRAHTPRIVKEEDET
ncbi:MAG TPA: hypothetical protein VN937_17660 [Blastocatellia bacterium]|nr:hypothetical protein [Blastocatellia bacterium]